MNAFSLFQIFFIASLLSFGGLGGLPILHQDLVVNNGWATDSVFARALAVGLISPGPNGLYIVSLGYLLLGLPGALAATLAALIPPFTIIPVTSFYERLAHQPRVQSAVHHLGLAVAAMVGVAAWSILRGTVAGPADALIALGVFALMARTRLHVVVPLALAALAGVLVHR